MNAMPKIIFFCVILLANGLGQEKDQVYRIHEDKEIKHHGRPNENPFVFALSGKLLRINWEVNAPDEIDPSVLVDVITHTRRKLVATTNGEITKSGLSWTWTPPKSRSITRYEARLRDMPQHRVTIVAHDPEWMAGVREKFLSFEWEAIGLTKDELKALKQIGISIDRKKARKKTETEQAKVALSNTKFPTKSVTWNSQNHDLVVWTKNNSTGDVIIEAPRWWISPEALDSDHGKIRLLKLFSEPSISR